MSAAGDRAVRMADILGCWQLTRAFEDRGGVVRPNPLYGTSPNGFLHYLAGGRMAVAIPLGERRRTISEDRRGATLEELAESARTFDAYAGRFTLTGPDRIVHHVEVSTHQNHVGTDLMRGIECHGDLLRLHVPPVEERGVTLSRWLDWRRV
ncbi:lipocalin-like domain-containing protein [Sphingomonas soli]|uniref:lipocalin-like domain-containing protein n=1 Tax=Sphingomonas soli TaxID=266127 RepID=UPI0008357812|nr:lipocalin-like domain-containing protein [Sphingomonas soli]